MRRLRGDAIFQSGHLSQDLVGKSVHGGMTIMIAQAVRFVLNLAGTMVLARLLTPADFGLIGMVMVVVGFAGMFKDAGLSMATVQRDSISREQISTLFWLNVLLSAILGLCILAASPLVAWFYGRPELTAVTAMLSLSFIITGLTIQHAALLRRHMQFGTLAVITIASEVLRLIVVILLALAGWRHWALVGGSLTTAFSTTLLILFFCPWMPGRMQRGTGIRGMLKFGGHLTGFNFLNYFARNADNVLIGRFWGADALGLYAKAYGLLMLPVRQINAPVTAIAIPVLSRLQNEPERYRNYYLKAISIISFITMPLAMFLAVMSNEIICIVLGPQWKPAGRIFCLLAVSACIQPICNTSGWLYVVSGRTDRLLKYGAVGAVFLCFSFVVGLPYGPTGVALAYACAMVVWVFPCMYFATRGTAVRSTDIFKVVSPAICAALIGAAGVYGFKTIVASTMPMLGMVFLCLSVFLTIYLTVMLAIFGQGRLLVSVMTSLKGYPEESLSPKARRFNLWR